MPAADAGSAFSRTLALAWRGPPRLALSSKRLHDCSNLVHQAVRIHLLDSALA
jgi:hypothetical protein